MAKNVKYNYRQVQSEEDEIKPFLNLLRTKGLIKSLENNAFTRVVQNETTVKVRRAFKRNENFE